MTAFGVCGQMMLLDDVVSISIVTTFNRNTFLAKVCEESYSALSTALIYVHLIQMYYA
jgi:hypothetical protein